MVKPKKKIIKPKDYKEELMESIRRYRANDPRIDPMGRVWLERKYGKEFLNSNKEL